MIVAIDGPAGSGKSTVARAVAERLNFNYLDTGAMYRCVALLLQRGAEEPPATVAARAQITLGERVLLDGEDITAAIRTQSVSEIASRIAADSALRKVLTGRQQEIVQTGDWVAEGRDIGTVVVPDAEVKIFLTASSQARAQRRAEEVGADIQTVIAEQAIRDHRDSSRLVDPLKIAADADELDTTDLTVEQVIDSIVQRVKKTTA